MVSSSTSPNPPSETQVGKYRLLRRIAAGGMAEVFLGTDDGKSLWAVKLILPHLADQPEFLGLFLDEARLASLINHPNVARVRDMGMENGRLFLAMEYARGQPLSTLLTKLKELGATLTPPQAAGIVAQAAAGLNAAHDAKARDGSPAELVHRDISPQNLLLTEDGVVKVVDFGIAKARNKLVVTQVNTTRGKPWYMSPEQMRGEKLDRRADIFSLGAVLFELLLGTRLFDGDVDQVMFKALNEPLPSLRVLKPDVPEVLADIVNKACARNPDDRFATAWDLEQELLAFVAIAGGSGNLGELITGHFPRMPATVEELVGPPAKKPKEPRDLVAEPRPQRPLTGRVPRPISQRPVSSAGGPPQRIRRPGVDPVAPSVGDAPPDDKTPAGPELEVTAVPATPPGVPLDNRPTTEVPATPVPAASLASPTVAVPASEDPDGAVKVRTNIPKRRDATAGGSGKRIALLAALIVAFTGLGGGGAYLLFGRNKKPVAPPPKPKPPALLDKSQVKANPFAAVDGLANLAPKTAPPAATATPSVAATGHDAEVRLSCSEACTVYLDGTSWSYASAGAATSAKVKPGRHTFSVTLGDENKRHASRTVTLRPMEVLALHYGHTDGKYLVGVGAYSYAADGEAHLHRGDYAAAARSFRMALTLSPSSPTVHRDLGRALVHTGQTAEARFQLETYLLLCKSPPRDADAVNAELHKLEPH